VNINKINTIKFAQYPENQYIERILLILLNMILRVEKFCNYLIYNTLDSVSHINKWRKDFITDVLWLFLSIKGRVNFSQLERFGSYCEQRYRMQFEKEFQFLDFNKTLVQNAGSGKYAIGFDPSYISKSGKHTPNLGYFWSGCASKPLWGLEIGGLAAIDIGNTTAFHLEAVQTPNKHNFKQGTNSQMEWYANIITERSDKLRELSNYLVVDAYFSKKGFIDNVLDSQMHVISRLRDDADLSYLCYDAPTGKKGRRKKYDGKINLNQIRTDYFELINQNEEESFFCAIVYSKGLKRNVKIVYLLSNDKKKKVSHKIYFSTDLQMNGIEIMKYYRNRFQMEFVYRDAKQHTGLEDCQARSENKLNFHFNASLTAVNIAKVEHWLNEPKENRGAFSMANVKTMYHNALLLQRFFDVFAINANSVKNPQCVKELINFGKIAA